MINFLLITSIIAGDIDNRIFSLSNIRESGKKMDCNKISKCLRDIVASIKHGGCKETQHLSFKIENEGVFVIKNKVNNEVLYKCEKEIDEETYKEIISNFKKNCREEKMEIFTTWMENHCPKYDQLTGIEELDRQPIEKINNESSAIEKIDNDLSAIKNHELSANEKSSTEKKSSAIEVIDNESRAIEKSSAIEKLLTEEYEEYLDELSESDAIDIKYSIPPMADTHPTKIFFDHMELNHDVESINNENNRDNLTAEIFLNNGNNKSDYIDFLTESGNFTESKTGLLPEIVENQSSMSFFSYGPIAAMVGIIIASAGIIFYFERKVKKSQEKEYQGVELHDTAV